MDCGVRRLLLAYILVQLSEHSRCGFGVRRRSLVCSYRGDQIPNGVLMRQLPYMIHSSGV